MLIGIDASRAVSESPTGTEVYSRELIRAWLAIDRRNSYRLYTRAPVERDFFAPTEGESAGGPDRFAVRSIPFPRLWTHARLSVEMLAQPPDLLFVPAHVLPLVHPRRSVVTVHDLGHLRFPEAHPPRQRAYHTWATRWNARAARHLFADSEATCEDLVQLCGVPRDKVSVIYPAYDAARFRPISDQGRLAEVRSRLGIGADYILAVGTLHPRKNYVRLVQAVATLANPGLELVVVGKRGWLYQGIFDQVRALGLKSRIRFLDYVPAGDLPALFCGARVFVFPSLHEGFGLPILEAQACRTPVVCSMTSSLPEAAGDGALFVDPCDVDAIAAAVDRLLRDDALRDKLVANGQRNLARFSWDASARKALAIFDSLA